MKNNLIIFLLLLFILGGCVEPKILDELNLLTAAGINLADEDKIKVTALYADFLPDKTVHNHYLEATMDKDADIVGQLEKQSEYPVQVGDIDVFILGREMAKQGIFPIVDSLQRNANIGSQLYFILSDGPMDDLIKGNYDTHGNAEYISKLIEHNIKNGDLPKTNLHIFASNFFQEGKDTHIPIIKKVSDKKIELTGIGIFKGEKLVHEIPEVDMFYFKAMVDQHNRGSLSVKVGQNSATIENIRTKFKIKANYDTLSVDIHIKSQGIATQYTGKRIDPSILKKIENAAEKNIKEMSLKLLKEFQEQIIDPVGIERKFRQQNRDFDSKKWKDQYPNVTFHVHPKVTIIEAGTVY